MIWQPWSAIWLSALGFSGQAYSYTPVPSPDLNLKSLGQVALGGDFDAITTYSYVGQQQGIQGNGTQSVLQQLPNGMYGVSFATDANIEDICAFTTSNGTLLGVIIAGNFTSIGGISAQSVAFINARTGGLAPHAGIQGSVSAVLCDAETNTAYLGGTFDASYSSNAIAWTAAGSWANLPFAGFDAPVTSIAKAPDGHIVFGGSFTGLKNGTTSSNVDQAVPINLATARISSVANTTSGSSVTCPSNDSTTLIWELEDNTAGSWTAAMRYGYEPSRLRLRNNQQGKGVRTFRFTALPDTGIMNLSYTDPTTGKKAYCDATCPLAQNTSLSYQDFEFVNRIGMDSFRLDVSAWYGAGGALRGIELFQNDTFVYAIESFNDVSCADRNATRPVSRATATGSWVETPSQSSYADYLTAVVGPSQLNSTNIAFEPALIGRGNYTIVIYTPGCIQDNSCGARGFVSVTGNLTSDGSSSLSSILSQTNDYDKYEQVYQGPIDPASDNFRPAVTIAPSGQLQTQLVVASRVRFSGNPSTGGLNGLFDFDPNAAVVDTDFSKSAINSAGTKLRANAQVYALASHGGTMFSAGSFTDDEFENIMKFANNTAQSLPGGGLNAAVATLYPSDDFLYAGGNFTGTSRNSTAGLHNVAAYDFVGDAWIALGNGVDGPVTDITPFQLNVTSNQAENVVGISGTFSNIRATGDHPQRSVDGFAVWVPSSKSWLQNVGQSRQLLAGRLCGYTTLPNNTWLGAGTLVSLGQAMSGLAGLAPSGSDVSIQQLPIQIDSSSTTTEAPSTRKRALLTQQNATGILAGAYDTANDRNVTILAGHFTARTNVSTVQNLVFLNGDDDVVTGLPAGMDDNSTFLALATESNVLFAGGIITGQVNNAQVQGLVLYDLANRAYRSPQPAALQGEEVIVNAIAAQSGTSNVYIGGSFETTSQGLDCASVCVYDTSSNLWSSAGGGLSGTVTALHFLDNRRLLAAGNLTLSKNPTSLAVYDTRAQTWIVYQSARLPGPVSAFAETSDDNVFWVSGTSTTNGSTYLIHVDNGNFAPILGFFDQGTNILGMQMMPLTNDKHRGSRYVDADKALMIMGQLNITGFGQASAALFDGTNMQPFILSVNSVGQSGSLATIFSSNNNPATTTTRFGHSRGIAVLVAFCAALGTIFLIILIGMIVNRIQRNRAGYSTLPSVPYQDKNMNINRVPPERLLASMGQRTPGAPLV